MLDLAEIKREIEMGGGKEREQKIGGGGKGKRGRERDREGTRERESLCRGLKCRGRTGVKYFTGTSELSQSTSESHSADIEI